RRAARRARAPAADRPARRGLPPRLRGGGARRRLRLADHATGDPVSAGDDERRASRTRARRTWALCGALVAGGVLVPAAGASVSPRVTAGLAVCQGFALTTTSPNLVGALGGWSRGTDAWGNPVRIEERINVVTGAGTQT